MRTGIKVLIAGYICIAATGTIPVYAAMDMEISSSFAGISVALNNYFAGSLEPEKELALALGGEEWTESIQLAAAAEDIQADSPSETAGAPILEIQPEETQPGETDSDGEMTFAVFATGQAEKSVNETPTKTAPKSAYEHIAVSQVSDYVNVRTEPNTGSAVVGKIYNNCAATILETVEGEGGSWYKIQSGTVTGYIKAQYFITGTDAEVLAQQIGKEFATINTASLRLREKADLTSGTLTMLSEGAEYVVLGEEGDFFKVAIDNDLVGYVASSYTKTAVRFDQAVSLEEEASKKREEVQRKEDADAAMKALEEVKRVEAKKDDSASENTGQAPPPAASRTAGTSGASGVSNEYIEPNPQTATAAPVAAPTVAAASGGTSTQSAVIGPGAGSSQKGGTTAVTSATRTAIVAYAKQFLGNPYVYGGTSLTNGADCSGFTQAIFANFDIAIGRNSRDQAARGTVVSINDIQPGDLLFYASGDYINHVALYIGGGEVIHASNSTTGIIISPYNYRTPSKAVTFLK